MKEDTPGQSMFTWVKHEEGHWPVEQLQVTYDAVDEACLIMEHQVPSI